MSNTVFIGNLDKANASQAAVTDVASAYGAIVKVDLIARGTSAYVKYASAASVNAAVAGLNGTVRSTISFGTTPLKVEVAVGPRPDGAPRGGRRD